MRPPPKPPRPSVRPEVRVDFNLGEESTPAKNAKVVQYQILYAIIDELFRSRREAAALDLIEIGRVFADATEDEREVILRVVRAVPRP